MGAHRRCDLERKAENPVQQYQRRSGQPRAAGGGDNCEHKERVPDKEERPTEDVASSHSDEQERDEREARSRRVDAVVIDQHRGQQPE